MTDGDPFEEGLAPTKAEREQMERALAIWEMKRRSVEERSRSEADAYVVRGRWMFYWTPVLKQLARAGRLQDAYDLAMELVDVAERELRWDGRPPPPGWTEKAAVYARKLGRLDLEAEVLERYIAIAGPEYAPKLTTRLELVRATIERQEALKPKPRPEPMF